MGSSSQAWAQAFWGGPTRKSSSFGAIISYNILYTRVSQEKKENKLIAPAAGTWYIMGVKRIKHNDLTHYFLRPHNQLPQAYLKSCKKFFDGLKRSSKLTSAQAPDMVNYRRKKL